jgi:hypothetical protein
MLLRILFCLVVVFGFLDATCQMNAQEKLRILKPLVAKVKSNPNDDAACQELLDAARIPMIFDSNNANEVAAFKETAALLQSLPEPCASSAASNQQRGASSAAATPTPGLSESEVQEAINQINAGFQSGYQNYSAEIEDLQSQIGPAQQEKAEAANDLQNTVSESLESVLAGILEEEKAPAAAPPTKEELLANYQLPPHGGYHRTLYEDSLVRIESDLRLIKSLKCMSTSSTRGVGPYGCYHYNLEIRLYKKVRRDLSYSGVFSCAFGFQEDAFDPFDCLKDEQGYWNRFYFTPMNQSWPLTQPDVITLSEHFWTTVATPEVRWQFKCN